MSTESILKPVIEIKGDEVAQRLLDVLEGPVKEIPRPSTDVVRGLDGLSNYIEHALVANNFVITIGCQMVAGQGRVFERIRYRLLENNCRDIVPDVSIAVDVGKRTKIAFTGAPDFVMEIVASDWERTSCRNKMKVYCMAKVPECWVVDWKEKRIEIYSFAEADGEEIEKYLKKTVTEKNKEELKISSLQNLQITFEELFQGI